LSAPAVRPETILHCAKITIRAIGILLRRQVRVERLVLETMAMSRSLGGGAAVSRHLWPERIPPAGRCIRPLY
jgi:hypothetical protein